jgi:hypothetical protein
MLQPLLSVYSQLLLSEDRCYRLILFDRSCTSAMTEGTEVQPGVGYMPAAIELLHGTRFLTESVTSPKSI